MRNLQKSIGFATSVQFILILISEIWENTETTINNFPYQFYYIFSVGYFVILSISFRFIGPKWGFI